MPLTAPCKSVAGWLEGEDMVEEMKAEGSTWEWWNRFRLMTNSSNKVRLYLFEIYF